MGNVYLQNCQHAARAEGNIFNGFYKVSFQVPANAHVIKYTDTTHQNMSHFFPTSYLQPVQSGHFSTDVVQLCQRVVQQNPVSQ